MDSFSVLRECLAEGASDEAWEKIKGCLEALPIETPYTVAVDYLRPHMATWPEEYQEALASWMPMVWTSKTRRRVVPKRGGARNPKSLRRPKPISVAAYREAFRDHANWVAYMIEQKSGVDHAGSEVLNEQLRAAFAEGSEVPLDVELEAYMWSAYLLYRDYSWCRELGDLASTWFATGGVIFVLDVLQEAQRWLEGASGDVDEELSVYFSLRRILATLTDEEHEAALAHAAGLWDDASTYFKCMLLFLFPSQREWGEALLEEERAHLHGISLLALASADLSCQARRVLSRLPGPYMINVKLYYSFLDAAGSNAFALLEQSYPMRSNQGNALIIEACAMFKGPRVAALFADHLDLMEKAPSLEEAYLKEHPAWAVPALEAAIAAHVAAKRPHPRATRLLKALKAVVAQAAEESREEGSFAVRSQLPKGLAAPPWRETTTETKAPPKKKAKKAKAPPMEQLPYEPKFACSSEEYAAMRAWREENQGYYKWSPEQDKELLAEWVANQQRGAHFDQLQPHRLTVAGQLSLVEQLPHAYMWCCFRESRSALDLMKVLTDPEAEHEPPDLSSFFAYVRDWKGKDLWGNKKFLDLFSYSDDPQLALLIAELAKGKRFRNEACAWLAKFPEAAAVGLIPAINNTKGKKKREMYEAALQIAKDKGDAAVVAEVAARYQGDEDASVGGVLDPYLAYPKSMPKMPAFWSPSSYPPLRLIESPEQRLSTEVIEDIGLMLKFSENSPYIGLSELKEVVDPLDLDRWSWALFNSWIQADGPAKELWPLSALALFGQGTMLRELPLLLDQWLMAGLQQRVMRLLEAFVMVNSPWGNVLLGALPLQLLDAHIADDLKTLQGTLGADKVLKEQGEGSFPTLGWSAGAAHPAGLMSFPERPRVVLNESLVPLLFDEAGVQLYDWPASEGPGRVAWEAHSQQLAWLFDALALRLDQAMRHKRRFAPETWREHWCKHPLMQRLTAGLVWAIPGKVKGTKQTFRVDFKSDTSGALLDAKGKKVKLPKDAAIILPHPLVLRKDDLQAWRDAFSALELAQPIPQLERPIFAPTEAEHEANDLARFVGKSFTAQRVFLLAGGGWRVPKRKKVRIQKLTQTLPNNDGQRVVHYLDVEFEKGIPAKVHPPTKDIKIASIACRRGKWALQDALWMSELIYDFVRLCED